MGVFPLAFVHTQQQRIAYAVETPRAGQVQIVGGIGDIGRLRLHDVTPWRIGRGINRLDNMIFEEVDTAFGSVEGRGETPIRIDLVFQVDEGRCLFILEFSPMRQPVRAARNVDEFAGAESRKSRAFRAAIRLFVACAKGEPRSLA